jgi:CDP-paratose 2-epimerase
MSRVLITGSTGLLGSACVELFQEKEWEVVGMDNNARSKNLGTPRKSTGFDPQHFNADITNQDDVEHIFSKYVFDAVIHCAGQASHDWSNDHVLEDFDINARGTVILLEATRKYCPDAVFVQVSTDKVYGENMNGFTPFNEKLGLDFAGHRSPFGCSKTAGDIYAQEYAHTKGMKTGIFRPGCITGKNHEGAPLHGFLAYIAKCIRTQTPYKVHGDGSQVRDQIHAKDLANAFYHFIQNPHAGEVYNIGGGPDRAVSLLEAVYLIEEHTGQKAILEFGHPNRAGDRLWDVHDVSKFKSHYPDWKYEYSLQDIINDVCSKEL